MARKRTRKQVAAKTQKRRDLRARYFELRDAGCDVRYFDHATVEWLRRYGLGGVGRIE